ncbi:MAG: hypothetical protein ACQESR_02525 [Planctomycetota bacterium]
MESCPTQSVLPLVGLAAEKIIRDWYIYVPNAPRNVDGWLNSSAIHRSTDNGDTWSHVTHIELLKPDWARLL